MYEIMLPVLVFYPMAGGLVTYLIGRRSKELRNYAADFVAVTEFIIMVYGMLKLQGVEMLLDGVCGAGLHFTMDGFRGVYGTVAALMWMMTILFSEEYFRHYRNRNRYYLFQLVTLGATAGVFLSADLFTTFIFFEVMSFTSYVWVAQDERKESLRAAETYLAVAVIGGMVLLMGLFLLYTLTGTLEIGKLYHACRDCPDKGMLYAAGGCLLTGFGAKAGAFPLHIWLPKAHPVAPAPASALLSGILTKAGVYGVLVVSCYLFYGDLAWGRLMLALGVVTMAGGAVLAMFSVDLKRTLACSSMSQIGFILTGVAMQCLLAEHNGLAVYGTFLHMVNHSLIKLVLFMAAGVIFMNIHRLDLNEIRGFGRGKPFLNFVFLMGALGIGGVPFWNGYVSKTLLHESIVEYSREPVFVFAEWAFLISGGLTAAYMLKLYICIFREKNADRGRQAEFDALNGNYINKKSMAAIGISALLLPALGISPALTVKRIAVFGQEFMLLHGEGHIPHFFSMECLKGGLISIAAGILIYLFIIRRVLMRKEEGKEAGTDVYSPKAYVDAWPVWLDLENLIYRPLIQKFLPAVGVFYCRAGESLVDGIVLLLRKTIYREQGAVCRTGEPSRPAAAAGRLLKKGDVFRASLSYGLQLSGIGMVAVIVYLFVHMNS